MDKIFLTLLNMGICAGWLILAVIVLRLMLRRAPKWIRCVLWAFVALRLICPFSLQSMFSLIPSAQTLRTYDVQYAESPEIHTGVTAIDNGLNPVIRESFAPTPGASVNPLQIWMMTAGILWLIGLLAMLGYALFGYLRLQRLVAEAVALRPWVRLGREDRAGRHAAEAVKIRCGIYVCDNIPSPFILGFIHPAVYLPAGLDEDVTRYVLAHEYAHLVRRDHWWKALGFLLLAVYWFHPLVWAAYILFCRDMELACDEKAIKNWNLAKKKAYSHALVSCSVQRKAILSCPLAFGEIGIRERVKAVLHYKKPTAVVITVSAAICALVAVCFLTNPVGEAKEQAPQDGEADIRPAPEGGTDEPVQADGTVEPAQADGTGKPVQADGTDEPATPSSAAAQTTPSSEDTQAATGYDLQGKSDGSGNGLQGKSGGSGNSQSPGKSSEAQRSSQTANTGYPLYDSLIESAAHVLAHPQESEYENERALFTSAYFYSDMSWQTPGYLLMDLDGNGVDELLFGENHDDAWNGIVFNIYTISDGKLVRIVDGWERNRYYLCENGCIANEGSGGASESVYKYYTYEETTLSLVESVVYDASSDPENPWFYTTDDPDADAASLTPVSEAEARRTMESYKYVLPQFTLFI